MSDAQKATSSLQATETTEEVSLLDQIVQEGRLARDPAAKERGKNLVKEFVTQVLEGAMTVSKDAEAMINARIAQIDHLVSIQLNEVRDNFRHASTRFSPAVDSAGWTIGLTEVYSWTHQERSRIGLVTIAYNSSRYGMKFNG